MTNMEAAGRQNRIEAYQRAFARAVLATDPLVRPRAASEWAGVVEYAVASGVAEFDEKGHLRLVAR